MPKSLHPRTRPPVRIDLGERRRHVRGPIQSKARLTIVGGPRAGETHEILMRDQSLSGLSFLLRESLEVGQELRVDLENSGKAYEAEVIRCRPISNGRHELALQYRKPL